MVAILAEHFRHHVSRSRKARPLAAGGDYTNTLQPQFCEQAAEDDTQSSTDIYYQSYGAAA